MVSRNMNEDPDSTHLVFLYVGGMLVPLIVSWLFHDVVSVYLSGREFTYAAAIGFLLLAWVFLEVLDTDRLDFISWAIISPWIFGLGMVVLAFSTGRPTALMYLFGSLEDVLAFAISFTVAGFAATVIRERIDNVSERYTRVPPSRTIAIGTVLIFLVAILAGSGLFTVSAMPASVTDVEPGVVEYRSSPYAALNVTVSGNPTELLLTGTTPDGDTFVKRIPRTAMQGESVTVPLESHYLDGFPKAGTYQVTVSAISGVSVDTATYTIDDPPSPSIVAVEPAGRGEPIGFELPSNASGPRRSTEPTDETRIAVVIENEGEVADDFLIHLKLHEDEIDSRSLFLEPAQQGMRIFAIPDEYVHRIHEEENGTVTVEVIGEGDRNTEEVRLPES